MGVVGTRDAVRLLRQGLMIESLLEDECKAFVGTRPERERPPTGRFEALGALACAQAQEPSTGPEPLLGMRP
jgi:hypothetical protein